MEESAKTDHLSNSLTDLMTSLMVIFILLLLAFISHTASKDAAVADVLLKKLQKDLKIQGIDNERLKLDPRDKNVILVIVPGDLMRFETQKSDLRSEGRDWLDENIPKFSSILCAAKYAPSVDSIVVEGHTDKQGWAGKPGVESENANLALSQERSMAVVKEALHSLEARPQERDCFLEKLSAVGRGQRDPEPTDEESRRVIFRIRVKATNEQNIEKQLR
ncbi:OmpA family protein [Bryocella elongata]|uniref:OmpA family protein n=1 Tax=Bryocella elongata TaxID=863522 RepID=A0A1H6AEC1_9BACT|nr:OmpA family protein [Bryocella elongata]SEG46620.1 OmpA family protein [Bryocella elongata]